MQPFGPKRTKRTKGTPADEPPEHVEVQVYRLPPGYGRARVAMELTDADYQTIERLARDGVTLRDVARHLGFAYHTAKQNDEFVYAYRLGATALNAQIANKLVQIALNDRHEDQFKALTLLASSRLGIRAKDPTADFGDEGLAALTTADRPSLTIIAEAT